MPNPPDELTRSTMVAIIARWNVAYHSNIAQEKIKKAADEAIAENNLIINACKATCRSLGYDREDEQSWNEALALFREDANELYNRTKPEGLPFIVTQPMEAASEVEPPRETVPETQRPPIKQIAVDRLLATGEAGLRASDIREYIERTYPSSTAIHEKTVGMTLYRLLKEGLVRRKGHVWFFVPPKAETKNPAGETAGLKTSQ
jgi:hypothetical protein